MRAVSVKTHITMEFRRNYYDRRTSFLSSPSCFCNTRLLIRNAFCRIVRHSSRCSSFWQRRVHISYKVMQESVFFQVVAYREHSATRVTTAVVKTALQSLSLSLFFSLSLIHSKHLHYSHMNALYNEGMAQSNVKVA